jgi:hypothetical protein
MDISRIKEQLIIRSIGHFRVIKHTTKPLLEWANWLDFRKLCILNQFKRKMTLKKRSKNHQKTALNVAVILSLKMDSDAH